MRTLFAFDFCGAQTDAWYLNAMYDVIICYKCYSSIDLLGIIIIIIYHNHHHDDY